MPSCLNSIRQTDVVKGTGVWNAFELKRDVKEEEEKTEEKSK